MKKTLTLLFAVLFVIAISCKKDDPKPAPSGNDNQKEQQDPPTEQKVEVTGVTLNEATLTLEVEAEETLTATVAPENATDKAVTWSSSDEAVATVDGKTGTVTAVAAGTATITATTTNGKTATCIVTVIVPAGYPKTIEGIETVYIPAGTFLMGSPETEPNRDEEELQHKVSLSEGFYMGKYEITNAQYCDFLNKNSSLLNIQGEEDYYEIYMDGVEEAIGVALALGSSELKGYLQYDATTKLFYVDEGYENYPVIVYWYGANEYAKWVGGALPTEAQWEYACRGGQTESLPFGIGDGTKLTAGMANFNLHYPYDVEKNGAYEDPDYDDYSYDDEDVLHTQAVGTYSPNGWGLYDMHGNVWEWCADWYGDYSSDDQTDPVGPESGDDRVIRGGICFEEALYCRSASRAQGDIGDDEIAGFRVIFSE